MLEQGTTIILLHDLGRFADLAALQAQYPEGRPGDFARLTSTETIWNWTGAAWVDTLVDAATFVDSKITFENTDPGTLGVPAAGKVFTGTYNGVVWTKDENGNVSFLSTRSELTQVGIKNPAYVFHGNETINIPNSINNNPDIKFCYWAIFSIAEYPSTVSSVLQKGWGGYAIRLNADKRLRISYYTDTGEKVISPPNVLDTKTIYCVFVTIEKGGNVDAYLLGDLVKSAPFEGAEWNNNSAPLYIGSRSASDEWFNGVVYNWGLFNTIPTAAKIKKYSLNPEAIDFEDEGASNIPVYSSDFSVGVDSITAQRGTGSGNNDAVSDGTTSKDDCYKYYANAESNSHYFYKNDWGIPTKKTCLIGFWYYIPAGQTNVDGFDIYNGMLWADAPVVGTWTFLKLEQIVANTRIDFRLTSGGSTAFIGTDDANDDRIFIKDIIFTQTGELEAFHPSGIGHNGWKGKYGSFAQNNGATPFNLPAHHIEADIIKTTSSNPSVTPPEGYVVESISIKTKADLTAIAAQQAGSLDNLVTGKVLDGSATEKSKTYRQIGDHEIFDGSAALNFTLTGNDANGTIITITYKREE